MEPDWGKIIIITKLFAHDEWKEIIYEIMSHFSQPCQLNPFMEDKALLKFVDERSLNKKLLSGKWRRKDKYHLKIETWDFAKHSKKEVIESYGGWLRICDLPLKFLARQCFEALGNLWHLVNISSKTFNLLDCSDALIHEVKSN